MTSTLPAIPVLDVELNLIRDGKKTQIRFPITQASDSGEHAWAICPARDSGWIAWFGLPATGIEEFTKRAYDHGFECPYGTPGDRLTCFPDPVVEIADVRVQRLGDISEEDAIAEGVQKSEGVILDLSYETGEVKTGYSALDVGTFPTAQEGFRFLWDVTRRAVAPYNPALWVWAITLRRIDQ